MTEQRKQVSLKTFRVNVRQKLRENFTDKPLGNRQLWRDIEDVISPVFEDFAESLRTKLANLETRRNLPETDDCALAFEYGEIKLLKELLGK